MTSLTPPRAGTIRPGGRTARVRAEVLRATRELLTQQGASAMRMELIAERSGVHRSTLYRRWKRPAGIIADLADDIAGTIAVPDTGDLGQDLRQLAGRLAHQLDGDGGALVRALLGWPDQEVQQHLEDFWRDRRADVGLVLQHHGIDADPALVTRLLAGPLHYRSLIERHPVDDETITAAVESTILAVLRTPRTSHR